MTERPEKPLWVAWWPKDALDGMAQLAPMEELAYRRILDFIFVTGDRLLDDDRALAWMTKAGRGWPRIKAKLIALGKIEVVEGRVTNERARAACIQTASFRSRQMRAAEARWAKDNQRETLKTGYATADARADPAEYASQQSAVSNRDSTPSPKEGEGAGKSPDGDLPPPDDPLANGKPPRVAPHPPEAVLLEMAAVWNEIAAGDHGLPSVRELTDRRRQQLRARCKERWTTDPVRQFRAYVTRICRSEFLTGAGGRGWKADFDWALQPRNVIAVAEGKYHDGEAGG